jgi:hypothetical protein
LLKRVSGACPVVFQEKSAASCGWTRATLKHAIDAEDDQTVNKLLNYSGHFFAVNFRYLRLCLSADLYYFLPAIYGMILHQKTPFAITIKSYNQMALAPYH